MTDRRGAEYWNERYRQKELVWAAEPNRFVVDAVEGLEPGRAIDMAAGEGRNAIWLARRGWEVTAVDWSDVAIDKARAIASRAGVEGIEFVIADLLEWEPPTEAFDLVLLVYLQIPDEERRRVWRKAAGAVAPGGRLAVIGHDSDNLVRGYGGPQHPSVLYKPHDVVPELEGFDVERAEEVVRVVEDDDGRHEAIDNWVIAVRR